MNSCTVKKGLYWVLVGVWCGFAPMAHAELDPSSVALPDGALGIGPNYGQSAIQFSSELALHLGHFQADPEGQSPSAFVGRFGICRQLDIHITNKRRQAAPKASLFIRHGFLPFQSPL